VVSITRLNPGRCIWPATYITLPSCRPPFPSHQRDRRVPRNSRKPPCPPAPRAVSPCWAHPTLSDQSNCVLRTSLPAHNSLKTENWNGKANKKKLRNNAVFGATERWLCAWKLSISVTYLRFPPVALSLFYIMFTQRSLSDNDRIYLNRIECSHWPKKNSRFWFFNFKFILKIYKLIESKNGGWVKIR